MKTLKGKNALVTGGTRGIGAASARHLATAGANVAITYSASADAAAALVKELEALGVKVRAYHADAAEPKSLPQIVEQIAANLGGIDILVNNAGTFAVGMIGTIDEAEYRRIMTINVDAVFTVTQAALKVMPDGGKNHQYRQRPRRTGQRRGPQRLQRIEVCPGRTDPQLGQRPRTQEHSGQRCATWADRYRHEPGGRSQRRSHVQQHGTGQVRPA